MTALWVALAGGAGAMARYVIDSWIRRSRAPQFPVGTLAINVSGSLILGVLTGLVIAHGASTDLRTIAGTGFCGGYTTFSAASVESVRLAQQRQWASFAAYTIGSLALSFAAAALGIYVAGA